MHRLIVLFTLLTAFSVHSLNAIDGGERVIGKTWSNAVALTYREPDGSFRIRGSGVLISPTIVLTAAHCVEDDGIQMDPANIRVHIGGGKDGGQVRGQFGVTRIKIHPQYRMREFEIENGKIASSARDVYDFAYLALDREVPTTFIDIIPPLPKDQVDLIQANAKIMCVGFGRRSNEGRDKIGFKNQLPTRLSGQIGATEVGLKQFYNSRIMPGDSGGPMFLETGASTWRLIGIHSRSPSANLSYSVGIAGFVTSIIDWLQWDSGADLGVQASELVIDEELANEYFLEAKHLRRNGTTGIAIEMLEKVLQVNPDNPEANHELALHYLESPSAEKAQERAMQFAKRAYELDPFSFASIYVKALNQDRQWEEALKLLNDAIAFDAENVELLELRTEINKALGRTDEVVNDLLQKEMVDSNLMPASGYDPRLTNNLANAVDQMDSPLVRNLLTRGAKPNAAILSKLDRKYDENAYQIQRLLFLNAPPETLKQTLQSAPFWASFHIHEKHVSDAYKTLVAEYLDKHLNEAEKNTLLEQCLLLGMPFHQYGWTLKMMLESGANLGAVSSEAVAKGNRVYKYPARALINTVKTSATNLHFVANHLREGEIRNFIKDKDRLALWQAMLSQPQVSKVANLILADIAIEISNEQFKLGPGISQVLEKTLKQGADPNHIFKMRSGFVRDFYWILLNTGGNEYKRGPLRASGWNKWPRQWFDIQQQCFKLLLRHGGNPQQGIPFSIVAQIDYYDTPLAIQNALNTAELFLQAGDNPNVRFQGPSGRDRYTAREYLEEWKFDSIYIEWREEPSYDAAKKLKKMLRDWERKRR